MADDKDPRRQRFFVKVHPLRAEGSDRKNPIPVNDLGDHSHGRAVCYPGKKGILSQTQIDILRQSVEYISLEISDDSGILEEANPIAAAEKQYPGFTARIDQISQRLLVFKEDPRFSVEILGPVPSKEEEAAVAKAAKIAAAEKLLAKKKQDDEVAEKLLAKKKRDGEPVKEPAKDLVKKPK